MAGFQNKVGTLTLMKWPDDALGKFFALIDTLLLFDKVMLLARS